MKNIFLNLLLSGLRISAALGAIYLVFIGLVTFGPVETLALYHPDITSHGPDPMKALVYNPLPKTLQEVHFTAKGGIRLNGWYVPAADKTKPTILFAHGNAGNMGDRIGIVRMFTERGYGFFAFDYRGYGKSQGAPSEQGLYQDFAAASRYLAETQHIAPLSQVALGESLGSAVVINAATQTPFRAVVVYSTLTSSPAVADHLRDKDMNVPLLKYILPLGALIRQSYNSLDKISQVRSPLLIMHGDRDEMMPVTMPKALYSRAASPHKALVIIPGAGHNEVIHGGEKQLFTHLEQLLHETTTPTLIPNE